MTQIFSIREKHHAIARMLISDPAKKQWEIADEVGMSESQLSQVINSPIFQVLMKNMREKQLDQSMDVVKHLESYKSKAAKKLTDILDDPTTPSSLGRLVANDVLKITGVGQAQGGTSVTVNNQTNNLTFEQRVAQEGNRLEGDLGQGQVMEVEGKEVGNSTSPE